VILTESSLKSASIIERERELAEADEPLASGQRRNWEGNLQ